ncbi:MAG: MarR family winged helix-turn-helix transcriptional regulator [Holosporales bacterium]|jgi:DNA-binding MarR family transcriptional regulator|nr:MarR family winged helix-turn-helix transcriptional regulator [Holosporales bacterium]
MKNSYLELPIYGEKMHRLFLDVIKQELDNLAVADISSVQAFILMNVNDNVITMGEVLSRGYYVGSNASYNIKKMITNSYMRQTPSDYDKRAIYLSLTEKGLNLCERLENSIKEHIDKFKISNANKAEIDKGLKFLKKFETYWQDVLQRRN